MSNLNSNYIFPDPNKFDNNGLVAIGGDLSIDCILSAYKSGIFPWFNENDPYLWWSPNPRCVLFPKKVHISKSLKRLLKKNAFKVTYNQCFHRVIEACSEPRESFNDASNTCHTWITKEMKQAYINLHLHGFAMSVECWQENELMGGLYGVFIGRMFFGESMFSRKDNASKIALVSLCHHLSNDIELIDCQMNTEHIIRMGAELMDRKLFLKLVEKYT